MLVTSVVDANCMKYFQDERVSFVNGPYSAVIFAALNGGIIAIDDEGHARQEYFDCCRPSPVGMNLSDWINDQIIAKKIRVFPMDPSESRTLRKMGVPKKDHKWVAIAIGASASCIVTEDIDLFDPSEKNANAARKVRIKAVGGCVSNYLKRYRRVLVLTGAAFIDWIQAESEKGGPPEPPHVNLP